MSENPVAQLHLKLPGEFSHDWAQTWGHKLHSSISVMQNMGNNYHTCLSTTFYGIAEKNPQRFQEYIARVLNTQSDKKDCDISYFQEEA